RSLQGCENHSTAQHRGGNRGDAEGGAVGLPADHRKQVAGRRLTVGILSPMPAYRRNRPVLPLDETAFAVKQRKAVPHEFVLDAMAGLSPETRPMFGCLAVYVREKIVLILRDKRDEAADNGVWLATTVEHHESLRREFPSMRSIRVLGKKVTGWQVLPVD